MLLYSKSPENSRAIHQKYIFCKLCTRIMSILLCKLKIVLRVNMQCPCISRNMWCSLAQTPSKYGFCKKNCKIHIEVNFIYSLCVFVQFTRFCTWSAFSSFRHWHSTHLPRQNCQVRLQRSQGCLGTARERKMLLSQATLADTRCR